MKSRISHVEVVLLALKLGRGVDPGGAHLLNGHLHVVHPLDHLCVASVVDLLDEGVVLLPERHPGRLWGLLVTPAYSGRF